MKVHFLEARVPLTKNITSTSKTPYPNAFEFKSHEHFVKDLAHFEQLIRTHAALGHCLLKGELVKPLEWESRAGSTNANLPTKWDCFDLDGLRSISSIDQYMAKIGLSDVSYIVQWSASHGIYDTSIRAHIFILLNELASPAALKTWKKQINLTYFQPDLELTKTFCSLRWPVDVTTSQNDKLLFITPPQCNPISLDPFKNGAITRPRVEVVHKSQPFFDFSAVSLLSSEALKDMEEAEINRLRKQSNLSERKAKQFKLKEYNGETYLPNPDQATITAQKEERGFVYFNLNGGDSWGYYHPSDNPTFIYNFKGEPTYKTSELLPDYWIQIQTQRKQQVQQANRGKLFLAFRDMKTAQYLNGWYVPATDELVLHSARSERQLEDFLINYGQPVPKAFPIWDVEYDPHAPTIDLANKKVNTFKPSEYMRYAKQHAASYTPKPTPIIYRVVTHVFGVDMYDQFINWLAFCFKYRAAPKTAFVAHGTQGTGKGILMNHVITPIMGHSNVSQKRMEELEEKFNAHLENCLITFIDEAQISDSGRHRIIMSNLKNQITEPRMTIRKMRQSAYEVTNRVGFIFNSNKPDPVVVEHGDRRFNVGEYQPNKLLISDDELDALQNELRDFAVMLEQYPVDEERVRTPLMTEAKQQMIMVSRSSADTVADAINDGNLAVLWDALPTIEAAMLDTKTQIRLEMYKVLIHELIKSRRNKLTREELFIIFNYNVGGIQSSPWKFTVYLKHHGLQIKEIRIGNRTTKGVVVNWKNSDEWFQEKLAEISDNGARKYPLEVVSNNV